MTTTTKTTTSDDKPKRSSSQIAARHLTDPRHRRMPTTAEILAQWKADDRERNGGTR